MGYNLDVGVIIPAYNEEEYIQDTVRALKKVPLIDRILVVDDGSIDETCQVAKEEGADVICLSGNRGKAYALYKGLEFQNSRIVLFLDADLGESAEEAVKLIMPLIECKADVTIARFPMTKGGGGLGLVRGLSRIGVRVLTGKDCPCVLSGQRGFRREVLRPEMFRYRGFGIEFGMTVDLLNRGIKICEVEVDMSHRTTGRDWMGFLHRARQFRDISRVIIDKCGEAIKQKITGGSK